MFVKADLKTRFQEEKFDEKQMHLLRGGSDPNGSQPGTDPWE